jgi:hypothetical protein
MEFKTTPKQDMDLARLVKAFEGINYSLGVLAMGATLPGEGGSPQHNGNGLLRLLERIAVALEAQQKQQTP